MGFLKGEKCELCSRFLERRSGGRGGREAVQRALAVAGGVAQWPRGPSLWRAGWQGGQDGRRSGGPDGTVAKRALVLAGGVGTVAKRALVLAGGVARWLRGPSILRDLAFFFSANRSIL